MPVPAVWSPMIKAMMFPQLSERDTLRQDIAIGCCLDGGEFSRIRRIKWCKGPQIADMSMIQEPGDQALETDLFLTVDRDALVGHDNGVVFTFNGETALAEDDAIFSLTIADDDALFIVSIFELDGMAPFRLDDLPGGWALHALLF